MFKIPSEGNALDRAPKSRRDLLESTKLSKLKKLPPRTSFSLDKIPVPAVCLNCGGALEADNAFQQATKVCRDCIANYVKVDAIFNEHAEQKTRAVKMSSFIEKLNFCK